MIETRTYMADELEHGICAYCGQESDEILIGTDSCVDCIEAQRFYEMTMRGADEDDCEDEQNWYDYFK